MKIEENGNNWKRNEKEIWERISKKHSRRKQEIRKEEETEKEN